MGVQKLTEKAEYSNEWSEDFWKDLYSNNKKGEKLR